MKSFKEFTSINESLWDNIHKKRKSGKKMRKPGSKGAPSAQDFKNARGEAVSPAQQAAIAISKKERGEKPMKEGQMVSTEIDAMKKLFSTMQKQLLNMPSNQRVIQLNRLGKMYGMSFDNAKQGVGKLFIKTK